MRKQFIFIAIITILFCSCTGFFDLSDEERIVGNSSGEIAITGTSVEFKNNGPFYVEVFNSSTREFPVSGIINPIQPYSTSGKVSWFPTSDIPFSFYLIYYLEPRPGIIIPFIPRKWGLDFISSSIEYEVTTTFTIPDITNPYIIKPDEILIDDVGIVVVNNFSSTVQFMRSPYILTTENTKNIFIDPGKNGFYRVPANSTGYSIINNSNNNIQNLQLGTLAAGNVYIITVYTNGNSALSNDFPLTMDLF